MIKPDQNINDLLRQKFQDFEPVPPEHIWDNIEKSLDAKKGFLLGNKKYYAAALFLIALFSIGYFGLYSTSNTQVSSNVDEQEIIYQDNSSVENQNKTETVTLVAEEVTDDNNLVIIEEEETTVIEQPEPVVVIEKTVNKTSASNEEEIYEVEELGLFKLTEGFAEPTNNINIEYMNQLSISSIYSLSYGQPYSKKDDIFSAAPKNNKTKSGHWENTIFINPEFSLTNLDSVTILNSYSLGVETSRFFHKNWFVRFGINASFTGDKGFAKIDYLSNDFMGTYDDVYDVTFDTIGGIITPQYHTKTVEVWDSVRHIVVSEVTNKYLFAQVPVLLGYKNKIGQLNWYVYSGPAIGFQIAKWIDEPLIEGEDVEIINLDNKLPVRSSINYQLWIGAGVEYKLGRNTFIVLEPSYRHYFKSLYSDADYKFNTSGFALRLGINYKIGK